MKIRKSISVNRERKVFIHENKKEETVMVAIPSLHWSYLFSYDEMGEQLTGNMITTLSVGTDLNEATEIVHRIRQWTNEM